MCQFEAAVAKQKKEESEELVVVEKVESKEVEETIKTLQATNTQLQQQVWWSVPASFSYFLPCCSHARGILCGIHTPCMGSPFPSVHTRWYLLYFEAKYP